MGGIVAAAVALELWIAVGKTGCAITAAALGAARHGIELRGNDAMAELAENAAVRLQPEANRHDRPRQRPQPAPPRPRQLDVVGAEFEQPRGAAVDALKSPQWGQR
jgi:hypothetical protein